MNKTFSGIILSILMIGTFEFNIYTHATPFFENGQFTSNGIEWCEENLQLYEILGSKFFEHHKHSIESRVCASLYEDPLWDYDGPDRIQKLIEKSLYYSQLEISESIEESQTGIIDTSPAASKDETLLRGITEDGQITIQIIATKPMENTPMQINISFLDNNDSLISNINYKIEATQSDNQVMLDSNGYSERGLITASTFPLPSNEPVTIDVTINGIGLPEDKDNCSCRLPDSRNFA
ncbi:MAG: hypothetical protein ACE5RO_04780, partial [Candidatus Nitrosomaritimum yanchengensis]